MNTSEKLRERSKKFNERKKTINYKSFDERIFEIMTEHRGIMAETMPKNPTPPPERYIKNDLGILTIFAKLLNRLKG